MDSSKPPLSGASGSRPWTIIHPRTLTGLCAAALAAASLVGCQTLRTERTGAQSQLATPADLYGRLFEAVQDQQVFSDGKTFVDAVPRQDPSHILAAFEREAPSDKAALAEFVNRHFVVPNASAANGSPNEGRIEQGLDLRTHIQSLWPVLTRAPVPSVAGASALPLPEPFVVPGGRFREIYFWDSYFTMLGLKADGRQDLVESMLSDFQAMTTAYGHIPNGSRTYYLSRSQPPFLSLMTELSDRVTAKDRAVPFARRVFELDEGSRGRPAPVPGVGR